MNLGSRNRRDVRTDSGRRRPDVWTSARPDVGTSGCPDVRTSTLMDVRTSRRGRLDVWTSGRPDVQTSGRPDVQTSGRLDVRTSRRPGVWTSPQVRKLMSAKMTLVGTLSYQARHRTTTQYMAYVLDKRHTYAYPST